MKTNDLKILRLISARNEGVIVGWSSLILSMAALTQAFLFTSRIHSLLAIFVSLFFLVFSLFSIYINKKINSKLNSIQFYLSLVEERAIPDDKNIKSIKSKGGKKRK